MEKKRENTESNYEKQVYIARDIFLKFDQEELIRKFDLEHDEAWLYLRFLDRRYRISRSSGEISYCDSAQEGPYCLCLDFSAVMTIYDALCHSETTPVLSHQWCPVQGLQVTMSSPGTDTFTAKYAKLFSGRADELLEACRKLGGEQPALRASADVAWQFSVFPFFPVQMRFWDGDDEFEPKIQLLWDKNTLTFMHFETTYYLQGYLMQRLEEYLCADTGNRLENR